MNIRKIREYFDLKAESWDEGIRRSDEIIGIILDNAKVSAGCDVLDVACGTGVLIPDYLKRNAGSVTAVDISPKMAEIAAGKFPDQRVKVICADAVAFDYGRLFDSIIIYNGFPHFVDKEKTIERLSGFLKPGGILTVAHGMSRQKLMERHGSVPDEVSSELPEAARLAELFSRYLQVTAVISNEKMYQVAGKRK
ncbi:MAG: class I SAM-dependent methyltransferase [Erysipelotrichaceae bacterium]|nr:class I SAM-dependent methyltransferase [Erysipelotrichaceae bacterium]